MAELEADLAARRAAYSELEADYNKNMARLAVLEREEADRDAIDVAATRARIERDAIREWGCGWESRPGPATMPGGAAAGVVSLVGMSAESLRDAACARGVRVGVEHDASGFEVDPDADL